MPAMTDARSRIAQAVREAVPGLPVFASPPSQVTPPCVVLAWQGGAQHTIAYWAGDLRVTLIGPGGDNEAGLQALEALLDLVAPALTRVASAAVSWRAPGAVPWAGSQVLAVEFDVTLDLELGA